jgi:DNA-binding response OmpR family regulator
MTESLNLLLLGPDSAGLDYLRATLEADGFRVAKACSLIEAALMLTRERFDLMLLWLAGPDWRSRAIVHEIQRMKAGVRLLVLLSEPSDKLSAELAVLQVAKVLPASVDRVLLAQAVRDLI